MVRYVEVAINLPQIEDSYHYHLSPQLEGLVETGSLVIVPFGRQRVQGVVLRFVADPEVTETRPVEALVDEKPVLTPVQIALAGWMASETLSPLGACISLMLPPGLSQRADSLVRLIPDKTIEKSKYSTLEKRLINLLMERGELRGRQIDASIRHVEWRGALSRLARQGIVQTSPILPPPRVGSKTVRMVRLVINPDQVNNYDQRLSRVGHVHDRRMGVLHMLAKETGLVKPSQIYVETSANNNDLKALEDAGLIEFCYSQVWRDPVDEMSFVPALVPELTHDQSRAWRQIKTGLDWVSQGRTPSPFLLHGVTGSGKTELYLRAVKQILEMDKSVIVLVPEISLTPQTIKRFLSRFPGQVGVVHSQLSEGERYDTWRRVRNGELPIIVGPRSALFLPVDNLGLIVMDECDNESYDQQDAQPLYRGADTAVACAHLAGAAIILGSATPQVAQYYHAISGSYTCVNLPKRILAHRETIAHYARSLGIDLPNQPGEGQTTDLGLPQVSVVDMRQELQAGNRSIFSHKLQAALAQVLETNQQAILFLNRRGSATYVFCRECGYVAKCPQDDKPLTYHRALDGLLCHTCSYERKVPRVCPDCGSTQIRQLGTGTEKVEKLVKERFPLARTLRWDAETTRKKGAHDRILTQFTNRQADILIGTQMLAKGLDLPLVTLVGVVLAEVGLNLPDYRATERTFQVLTQVAGRAGRSPLGGSVILQTYEPDNYVIKTAAQQDYGAFYEQEMAYRRELGYPPYTRLVRLEYRHHEARKAERAARLLGEQMAQWIVEEGLHIDIIGPAPCFFSRMYGQYRWQIVLRGDDPTQLIRHRQPPDWRIEVDPPSLL